MTWLVAWILTWKSYPLSWKSMLAWRCWRIIMSFGILVFTKKKKNEIVWQGSLNYPFYGVVKQCRYGWFCGKCPLSNFIVWVGDGDPKDCERSGHQKEGGIDPLGSYRVLRRRVGAKGTQNFAPFRWRKMASNQNLKMVTIDFEIGGWDMPSFKTSLNLKNGDWEVSLLSFWEGRFSGI